MAMANPYNLTARELVLSARWSASSKVPFFGRGIMALTFIECREVPTAGVDKFWRVHYNPDYYTKCAGDGTLVGEIIHELLHMMKRHNQRERLIGATDHAHWNGCADAEEDQNIEALGVKLVDKRVKPEDLGGTRGMSAEELYRLPRKQGKGGGGTKCHCAGGSGVTGEKAPWETPDPNKPTPPKPKGLTQAEADLVVAAIAHDVKEYAEKHGPGRIPADILRWAEQALKPPPVDWQTMIGGKLRYQVEARRGPVPSYSRPSRRRIGGLILPVHRQPLANVALVIDTSASVTKEHDLPIALAATFAACEALGRVTVIPCDAEAYEPVEVRCLDDLKPFLKGGGGTSMTVGIERAEELCPDAIAVVTDGETGWPDEEPDVPVTIILTRNSRYGSTTPPWAEVVHAYETDNDN